MRSKKIISTELRPFLDQLTPESLATYLKILLMSDDAGLSKNDLCSGKEISELHQNGLVLVTAKHIVIKGFLSANYGKKLNPEYSPTKSVFQCIADAGYSYNPDTNEIEVPERIQITSFDSLNKPMQAQMSINDSNRIETTPQVTKISHSTIIDKIKDVNFALWLSMLLMIGQSIHTANTLMDLTHLPSPYNEISAIFTALIMDSLIIYFVANGKVFQSSIFFVFCSMMGLYSYHIDTDYFTYKSLFAIVVSIAVPFSIHAVSDQINSQKQ